MASTWDHGFYYVGKFTPFTFPFHYIPGPSDLMSSVIVSSSTVFSLHNWHVW